MEAREDPPSSLSSSPSNKKSRRSAQKRVVSVPVSDQTDGGRSKGGGEAAPPSDSWAWRKYGQKPIKGSPYPRGYYRCSSSKGCPARKQVERSRVDPSTFIVTYSSEHDHSLSGVNKRAAKSSAPVPARDLVDAGRLMMMEEGAFEWFAEVGSSASASPTGASAELYCGPMMEIAATIFDDKFGEIGATAEEEEDSLFAGLGELPECSVVFRRGFPAWCSGEAVAGRGGREEVRN